MTHKHCEASACPQTENLTVEVTRLWGGHLADHMSVLGLDIVWRNIAINYHDYVIVLFQKLANIYP